MWNKLIVDGFPHLDPAGRRRTSSLASFRNRGLSASGMYFVTSLNSLGRQTAFHLCLIHVPNLSSGKIACGCLSLAENQTRCRHSLDTAMRT